MNQLTSSCRLRPDTWLPAAVIACTLGAFAPLVIWLFRQTATHDQLLHAFFVLGLAGATLIYERRLRLSPQWEFSNTVLYSLLGTYILIFASYALKLPILILPAFCLTIAATLVYVFGNQYTRMVAALMGAFGVFVLMALILPMADWPLRHLAGEWSAWLFSLMGQETELRMIQKEGVPMLLLLVNGTPFHVAPECNGFGVLTSSLLLSSLLVLYRRIRWYDKLSLLVAAGTLAFFFNLLRIVIIIFLAPVVGGDNYFVMHEIVGVITYYGCLGVIWYLTAAPARGE